ncbi:MAG TPA: hypothetical protein VFR97_01425 [Capillimicrobium sp.]|nr:hypothetical protein [Capillimicrobium sp.]
MRIRPPIVALACLAVAGCGANDDNPEEQSRVDASGNSPALVPAADLPAVERAAEAITTRCEQVGDAPVRTLIRVYEQGPEDIYDAGDIYRAKSMTQILEIKRDELRECGQDELAGRLDDALGES